MKKTLFACALAVAAALTVSLPVSVAVAAPDQHHPEHRQLAQPAPATGMKMADMKMDEMAAQRKANTERISALMAQVKTSTGDIKLAAMADVIAVLLEERAAMQEHCAVACSMTNAMMKK